MKAVHQAGTRDRIVEAAMALFHERGYEATGLAEVLQRADCNSGSLYYFFKSKEELLLAVLDRYDELLWPVVIEPVHARTRDPIERVFGVLDCYREALRITKCTMGCPIGNLALELADSRSGVRKKIAGLFDAWCAAIRQSLDEAAGRLPQNVDREQLSRFVLAVMEGGVMQARAYRSLERFDEAVSMLRDYFDRLIAQPQKGARPRRTTSNDRVRESSRRPKGRRR